MEITYKQDKDIAKNQLELLYADAGWTAYTKDMDQLHKAVLQSFDVLSAWDGNTLVGLVRAVSDGISILYIQDILVLQNYQNNGIASVLMHMLLDKHQEIRQNVLLTEDAPDVRHFYEKNGFHSCDQGAGVAFAQFHQNA